MAEVCTGPMGPTMTWDGLHEGRMGPAVHALLHSLAGDVEVTGLDILGLIKMIANRHSAIAAEGLRSADLSGPRWGLLLSLYIEESLHGPDGPAPGPAPGATPKMKPGVIFGHVLGGGAGVTAGVTPTHLSRIRNVSKNTISALLRGLEEQGLIERALDPEDRRGFRIRLTEAGRDLVRSTSPQHLARLNLLASGLTPDEQRQLVELVRKLYRSLTSHQPPVVSS